MTSTVINLDAFANVSAVPRSGDTCSYNKNSAHIMGKQAAVIYDEAHNRIHKLFPYYNNIEFVSGGGTQANKRAIIGSLPLRPKFISQGKRRNIILVSSIEHTSILSYIVPYLKNHDYIVSLIPCDNNGVISVNKLEQLLETYGETVAMVSIMNVNNETGIVQKLGAYLEITNRWSHIVFHSDMAQGIHHFYQHIKKHTLIPDIVTFSGYKLGVPNYGILMSRHKLAEDYFGTVDVAGISHIVDVLDKRLNTYIPDIKSYLASLIESQLTKHEIKHHMFAGIDTVDNAISLLLFGYQSSMIQQLLSAENICIGTGSACSGKANSGSNTIKEMGYADEITYNLIRLTWHEITTEDVNRFVNSFMAIIIKLRPLVVTPRAIMNEKLMIRSKSQDLKELKQEIETHDDDTDSVKYKLRLSVGESYLKGGNRDLFITLLINDITKRLKQADLYCDKMIRNDRTCITVFCKGICGISSIINILKSVPGVSLIALIRYFKNNQKSTLESLLEKVYIVMSDGYIKGSKICVRSKVHDKDMITNSATDLNVMLGQMMVDRLGSPVDLKNPDVEFGVSFYASTIEIITEKHKGISGLPLGSEGTCDVIINGDNILRSLCACIKLSIRGVLLNLVTNDNTDLNSINDLIQRINPYVTFNDPKNMGITVCESGFGHLVKHKEVTSLTAHMTKQDVINYLAKYDVHINESAGESAGESINGTSEGAIKGFLSMISGGIDSPVSTYMMNKYAKQNGGRVVLIHFATSIDKTGVVKSIRNKLGINEMYIIEFQKLQFAITEKCPENYRTILFKLFMVRIANEIAKREQLDVIVMGNSLGQVASQTYENIVMTNQISDLPIYNPLLGTSKDDIIDEARLIGTYDDSICTGTNDCCTMFLPEHPILKANYDVVNKYFAMFNNFMELVQIHKI